MKAKTKRYVDVPLRLGADRYAQLLQQAKRRGVNFNTYVLDVVRKALDNPRIGSTLDSFLEAEGIAAEVKRKAESIFVLTTVGDNGERSRAWAWFRTLHEAKESFAGERGDFYEEAGWYSHIVVEETPAARFTGRVEHWFKWMPRTKRWKTCAKPAFAKRVCNWGLG